ncbi:MAG TPA: Asp-tRNA(Asn)/Glu-tRNA(Gln) amidotransferase subunit GatB [Actinomycetota bacterium]|nr:Asp-tRNA(Asn)/Glu-tRNA(Gln) amidotransferase subunit GatB [Actinomycetota bacterium]
MGGVSGEQARAMTMTKEDLYETTVGLEVHVELSTVSKMFCGCAVSFGGDPNIRTCPVCLGMPGSLPVANEKALEHTMRIALALNCSIAQWSLFHRKNYFYPDMPKNYQISQYDFPIGTGGFIELHDGTEIFRVGINRVHLEEDTGKSIHVGGSGRIADSDYSLEDFNRAGTPLVEIVSEPDIRSAEQARVFVAELRAILESLKVSDVRMEEGSMRVDANVSVRRKGEKEFGAKVEVKNMNSIRSVGRALEHEEERQRAALDAGETLIQETRHFDEKTGTTSSLRTKEFAFDYRYFPEPDLVPIEPSEEWIESVRASLPELPVARRARFVSDYGLNESDVAILTTSGVTADWFEAAAKAYGGDAKKVVNWIIADLFGLLNEAGIDLHEGKVSPEALAGLVKLVDSGAVSGKQAKLVLAGMFESGDDAETVARAKGLEQVSDTGAIESAVDAVIAANADAAEKVRGGALNTMGFLVGQVMKETKGQANPAMVNEILKRKLGV